MTSMPFRPMSAVWMRAHELGQPLTLTVIGVSSSGTRCSSSSMRSRRAAWSRRSRACSTRCRCTPSCCGATATGGRAGRSRRARRRATRPCPRRRRAPASFCIGVVRTRSLPWASTMSATWWSRVPEMRPTVGGGADVELAVLLTEHADVVGRCLGRLGRLEVDERALEVFGLQHLAELLDAPVGDEELQASPGAQAAVAVVAEDADDALPHLGHLVERHPHAEALGQHRVGRQPAADPEVEAGTVLGVHCTGERDVVDLRHDVVAGVTADRGLELARQVGELLVADELALDRVDRRGGVDDLVGGDAGDGGAEDDAGAVAAGFLGRQADRFEAVPDRRHVADVDPVVLHVLAVRQVGGVATELDRDVGDGTQLLEVELSAVDAYPHHEVLGVQLFGLERCGLAAVDAFLALRVEAPPAEAAAQVAAVDRGEAAYGVDVLDAGADVERVVVLLGLLVGVQRLAVAQRPLALAALGARSTGSGVGTGCWCHELP